MLQNQQTYSRPEVAAGFARQSDLQPPEETILRLMLPRLLKARMLDLGVGGGRTTLHFAKWVREYVGADYSESMIAECERRFAGYPLELSFQVCDARSMTVFESHSFDFILFSFNGIDYVAHEDRLRVLGEIRRVGKPGGFFCFSSHNLNWCRQFFEWRRLVSLNPQFAIRTAKRLTRRFICNRGLRASVARHASHMLFNDGALGRLRTYFIRPSQQLAQLREGFGGVRIFSLASGGEITDREELERIEEPWLYYLCEIR
jgi:ubiquinone/menaquinone biosynthesis C-methylase UbiE